MTNPCYTVSRDRDGTLHVKLHDDRLAAQIEYDRLAMSAAVKRGAGYLRDATHLRGSAAIGYIEHTLAKW